MEKVFDKNSAGFQNNPLIGLLNYIKVNGKYGAYFMCVDGTQFAVVSINGSTKAFTVKQQYQGNNLIKISSKNFSDILSECPNDPRTLLYTIFEPDNDNGLENGIGINRIGEFFSAYSV